MKIVQYYTDQAVESLRDDIETNLDWYYTGKGVQPAPKNLERPVRESHFRMENIMEVLEVSEENPSELDSGNAIRLYAALPQMTPKVASMEKLWTRLSHGEGAEYISRRWLVTRPEDNEKAAKAVRNHFFAKGNRGVIRDNGLSRLWWLGHIAHRTDRENPDLFLDIVLHRQDVRSALVERPSVAMNEAVLCGIYSVMKEKWAACGRKAKLFQRDVFRGWMIGLNRRGGIVLLDALPEKVLNKVLWEEAEAAGA